MKIYQLLGRGNISSKEKISSFYFCEFCVNKICYFPELFSGSVFLTITADVVQLVLRQPLLPRNTIANCNVGWTTNEIPFIICQWKPSKQKKKKENIRKRNLNFEFFEARFNIVLKLMSIVWNGIIFLFFDISLNYTRDILQNEFP